MVQRQNAAFRSSWAALALLLGVGCDEVEQLRVDGERWVAAAFDEEAATVELAAPASATDVERAAAEQVTSAPAQSETLTSPAKPKPAASGGKASNKSAAFVAWKEVPLDGIVHTGREPASAV